MSTPFPLEEAAQQDTGQPVWDPWKGPDQPHWYSGWGFSEDTAYLGPIYRLGAMTGTAAAKGEQLLGGAAHLAGEVYNAVGTPRVVGKEIAPAGEAVVQDARERLRDLRPDPQTTGVVLQALHSLGSGLSTAIVGSALGGPVGVFGSLSTSEGYNAYQDLLEAGVRPSVAGPLGAVRGVLAGAGGITPMAFGSALIPRLATGMASNVGFGVADRSIDSAILRRTGYDEMADQEAVFDRTQLLTDLALGAGFGAWAHIHSSIEAPRLQRAMDADSSNRDAALTANLALRDRASSPGIPTTPADAAAHARALQKALQDLQDGQRVNVAGTGIEGASVLSRGGEPNPEAAELFARAVQDSGLLESQAHLDQLEDALGRKLAGEPVRPPAPSDRPINDQIKPDATDDEKLERIHELTAENLPRVRALVEDLNSELPNTESHESVKSDQSIVGKAHRPEILAKRPWWGLEHLADTLRFKTVIGAIGDIPRVMELLAKHGVEVVKFDEPKFEQPNDWGWRVLPIDLRMPNGQLVEHYLVGRHMNEAQAAEGHGLFEKWRYRDPAQLTVDEVKELYQDKRRSYELYTRAWRDDFEGEGANLTAARAALDKARTLAGSLTRTRPSGASPTGRVSVQPSGPMVAQKPSAPSTSGSEPSSSVVTKSRSSTGTSADILHETEYKTSTVSTAAGRQIEVRPRIAELADLLTSDQKGYPAELQPRQRGERQALAAQVQDIAQNLTPERLGASAEADRGAPIVSSANEVESGNGRVMALRQVYAGIPEKEAAYRAFLEQQGYDLTGFKQPVLVRERVTAMNMAERATFALESNQAATAALSAVERGAADARRLSTDTLSLLADGGELDSRANQGFVRAFMDGIPVGERSALMNPDGTLSQEGVRRIQGAVLAKAFGGTDHSNRVLLRMLESTEGEQRSILGALLDTSPAFARLRQMVEDGVLGQGYDVTKNVLAAVEEAAKVREAGQALEEHLKQADMLTPRDPITDAILRTFYSPDGKRLAGRPKISEALRDYVTRAAAQRLDQGSLFAEPPLGPEQLLGATLGARKAEPAPQRTGDMFGLRTQQGAKPTAEQTAAAGVTRIVDQALNERPDLALTMPDGTVPAAAAKLQADEDTARTESAAPGVLEAAVDCFLRTGT